MTQIGEISQRVIDLLQLDIEAGTPIYIGDSNLKHMRKSHPKDFKKYGSRLERILSEPDYVGLYDDNSIEYIKAFGMYIKVAVRITQGGEYYARTLYHVDDKAARRLIKADKWKPVKSID